MLTSPGFFFLKKPTCNTCHVYLSIADSEWPPKTPSTRFGIYIYKRNAPWALVNETINPFPNKKF